jgi:hypothetical protein
VSVSGARRASCLDRLLCRGTGRGLWMDAIERREFE